MESQPIQQAPPPRWEVDLQPMPTPIRPLSRRQIPSPFRSIVRSGPSKMPTPMRPIMRPGFAKMPTPLRPIVSRSVMKMPTPIRPLGLMQMPTPFRPIVRQQKRKHQRPTIVLPQAKRPKVVRTALQEQVVPQQTWGFFGIIQGTIKTAVQVGAGIVAGGVGTMIGVTLAPLLGGGVLVSTIIGAVSSTVFIQSKSAIQEFRAGESAFNIGRNFVIQSSGVLVGQLVGGQLVGQYVTQAGSALTQQGVTHILATITGAKQKQTPVAPPEEKQMHQFRPPQDVPPEIARLLAEVPEEDRARWFSDRAKAITTLFTLGAITAGVLLNVPGIGATATSMFAGASLPNIVLRGMKSSAGKQMAAGMITGSKPMQNVLNKIQGKIAETVSSKAEEKEGYIPLLLQQELFNVTLAEVIKSVSRTTLQVGLQVGTTAGIKAIPQVVDVPNALHQINQMRAAAVENVKTFLSTAAPTDTIGIVADRVIDQNMKTTLDALFAPVSFEDQSGLFEEVKQPEVRAPLPEQLFEAFKPPVSLEGQSTRFDQQAMEQQEIRAPLPEHLFEAFKPPVSLEGQSTRFDQQAMEQKVRTPLPEHLFEAFKLPVSEVNAAFEETMKRVGVSMDHPAINPMSQAEVFELEQLLQDFEQSRFHDLGETLPTMNKHWYGLAKGAAVAGAVVSGPLGIPLAATLKGAAVVETMYNAGRTGAFIGSILNGFGYGETVAKNMEDFAALPGVPGLKDVFGQVGEFRVHDASFNAFVKYYQAESRLGAWGGALKGWMDIGLI